MKKNEATPKVKEETDAYSMPLIRFMNIFD